MSGVVASPKIGSNPVIDIKNEAKEIETQPHRKAGHIKLRILLYKSSGEISMMWAASDYEASLAKENHQTLHPQELKAAVIEVLWLESGLHTAGADGGPLYESVGKMVIPFQEEQEFKRKIEAHHDYPWGVKYTLPGEKIERHLHGKENVRINIVDEYEQYHIRFFHDDGRNFVPHHIHSRHMNYKHHDHHGHSGSNDHAGSIHTDIQNQPEHKKTHHKEKKHERHHKMNPNTYSNANVSVKNPPVNT